MMEVARDWSPSKNGDAVQGTVRESLRQIHTSRDPADQGLHTDKHRQAHHQTGSREEKSVLSARNQDMSWGCEVEKDPDGSGKNPLIVRHVGTNDTARYPLDRIQGYCAWLGKSPY